MPAVIFTNDTFTVATPQEISWAFPGIDKDHEHYFIPAISSDGKLIAVCKVNGGDCPATLTYDELIERLNTKTWIEK